MQTEKMEPPEGSEERRGAEESMDPGDPGESDTPELAGEMEVPDEPDDAYISVDLTKPEDAGETKDPDEQAAADGSDEPDETGIDGLDKPDEAGIDGSDEPGEAGETKDLTDTQDAVDAENAGDAADPRDTEDAADVENAEGAADPKDTGDAADAKDTEDTADLKDTEDAADTKGAGRAVARPGRPVQPRKRTRKNRRRKRLLKVLLVLAILAAFFAVMNLPYFEVQHIPVIGNKTVSDKKIRKLSEVKRGDKIFLLNPWLIESRIKTNLYIEDVKVKRDLPGTVELIVREREPAAQIIILSREGQRSYVTLDRDGMVMEIKKKKKDVTMVHNVVAVKAEPGSQVKVDDTGTYHKAMELIRAAQAGDLYFKRIDIMGSQVRAYIYDGLVCKGRYRNIIDSINSGTLKSVVYRLYQEGVEEGVINIGDNNYCAFTPQN